MILAVACRRDVSAATPKGASDLVVGVSLLNLSSEFIVMLEEAMRSRAKELGVTLIVNDAQRSAERQIQQVEGFAARRVSAIILNPCEFDASSPAIDVARGAGIPIINVNSETRSAADVFVGSDDEESARIAFSFIAEKLKGKGRVVMMHGFWGQAAQIKRAKGAQEVLAAYPELKLLAEQTAEWDRSKAVGLMENWIQAYHGQIDAVFAQNDEMGMGAVIALEQAGVKNRVLVVSIDAIRDALAAVKAGRLDATVFQDAKAQGAAAVEMAVALARHQPTKPKELIPFRLVTPANVDVFLK